MGLSKLKKISKLKKKCLSVFLVLVLFVGVLPSQIQVQASDSPPAAWDGRTIDVTWYDEESTTFYIHTPAEFAGFAKIVNNKTEGSDAGLVTDPAFKVDPRLPADDFIIPGEDYSGTAEGANYTQKTIVLCNDIDLGSVLVTPPTLDESDNGGYVPPVYSGNTWTAIGSYTPETQSNNGLKGRPFKGIFNGNYHEITNLYVPIGPNESNLGSATGNSHGLFGDLGLYGIVKNTILKSGYIHGARFTAGIVGRNWGTIEKCANFATIETNGARSGGGIAGVNYKNNFPSPKIENCYNRGIIVTGDQARPGGIVSDNEGTVGESVKNCYNIAKMSHKTLPTTYISGGIVGGQRSAISPGNCYTIDDAQFPTRIIGANANTIKDGSALGTNAFKTQDEMASPDFVSSLGSAYTADSENENDGFPVFDESDIETEMPYVPYDVVLTIIDFDTGERISCKYEPIEPMVTVIFNANGGNCAMTHLVLQSGSAIGNLPTASKVGYVFDGFWTALVGGTKITQNTIINGGYATVVFARYKNDNAKLKNITSSLKNKLKFSPAKTSYTIKLKAKESKIKLTFVKAYASQQVSISSKTFSIAKGKSLKQTITVTAESGRRVVYTIIIKRAKK